MVTNCLAMILAGGEGKRLGKLAVDAAKPAVYFGGKYRIIDFTLSNCANSNISTIGILTQYVPQQLNYHIGVGKPWGYDTSNKEVHLLPPFKSKTGGDWYLGTGDAIYQNIAFIDQFAPEHVLILSGDHIYHMDYRPLIAQHMQNGAAATISVIQVPWEETNRFGIVTTKADGKILEFDEKPLVPKSNLASMGIYVFTWEILKNYLIKDAMNKLSQHDFGRNILPAMLQDDIPMFVYHFHDYWRDVGTITSYWQGNMDLLGNEPAFSLTHPGWQTYTKESHLPPQWIRPGTVINDTLVSNGCMIKGKVVQSIICEESVVEEGATVYQSIIHPRAFIGKNVTLERVIISENVIIPDNTCLKSQPDTPPMIIDQNSYNNKQIAMLA